MKCFYLTHSYPDRETGLLYSTHDRIMYAIPYWEKYKIIKIQFFDDWTLRLLKILIGKKPRKRGIDKFEFFGLTYYNFWIKRSLFSATTSWGKFDKFRISKLICNENYLSKTKLDLLVNDANEYDIIMAHWGYPTGRIAMKISQVTQKPYCVTYHGSDINVIPFKNRIYRLQIQEALIKASMNFMVSRDLFNKVKNNNDNINAFISPNGIPENIIQKKRNINKSNINILFIGSLNYVKRADKLAEIIKAIIFRTNKKIVVTIIGKGEYQKSIETELTKSKIYFNMIGEVPRSEVMNYLGSADYLLLPSRNEGLPLVILEAIAKHVIPVASKVGGLNEVLENDFLVDESELFVDKFAEKVVELINYPKLPSINIKDYTWKNIIKNEIDIIKKLIDAQ